MSRRAADSAIEAGRITIGGEIAKLGDTVEPDSQVALDDSYIKPPGAAQTIKLNKPIGYVCSRDGQGSKTIYELLPPKLHHLKPVGRLDKDSSGLLLLTNDGQLANRLTHPRYAKEKVYIVHLDKTLSPDHLRTLQSGVMLDDGMSTLDVQRVKSGVRNETQRTPHHTTHSSLPTPAYEVRLHEGRNRQIRRTFEALGYRVIKLHRTNFGDYSLGGLAKGTFQSA